jgi:hypothetical protein
MSRKGEDRPYHRHVSWLETHKDSLVLGEIDFVNTVSPKGRVAEGVAFRIIWRNVSELFGVVSALRRNASQTEAATNMATIHKQNQIFTTIVGATLGSREGTLVLPRRSSGLSSTPNSSQNTTPHSDQSYRHVVCDISCRRYFVIICRKLFPCGSWWRGQRKPVNVRYRAFGCSNHTLKVGGCVRSRMDPKCASARRSG